MGFRSEDIQIPKVILSILGYTTKSSIAALKSKKSVQHLENEFLKRKNTSTLIDKHYEKYPFLRDVICFPSGLQVVLLQIALFVCQNHENIQQITAEKILNASECKEITAANILLSENGLSCKIICPRCNKAKVLSSCSTEIGSTSFSAHNFDRHYNACRAAAQSHLIDISSKENVLLIDQSEGISRF